MGSLRDRTSLRGLDDNVKHVIDVPATSTAHPMDVV
jgi:hypothetical protein